MNEAENILLNSGHRIPQLGFGVFKVDPAVTERVTADALDIGYRHIDTAAYYENEEGVGAAIARSEIPRDELFITTKVWYSDHGTEKTLAAIDRSLEKLGLDYVDLYLIHWPAPKNNLYVETWLAMEKILASGKAKSIGVSNFHEDHLTAILEAGSVVPAVNQIELHPLLQQRPLRQFGEARGIKTEAWGPLGQGKYDLGELTLLTELAEKYGKSVQQIVIRWHLQEGIIVFPKTLSRERMQENIEVFDFELSSEEMQSIATLNRDQRFGKDPDQVPL